VRRHGAATAAKLCGLQCLRLTEPSLGWSLAGTAALFRSAVDESSTSFIACFEHVGRRCDDLSILRRSMWAAGHAQRRKYSKIS
jgi:hypothetical protein